MSSIITHHLVTILKNTDAQISGVMSERECHHGLKTYAPFIDLVKAFNSVNHELIYNILMKFGVPNSMINVI